MLVCPVFLWSNLDVESSVPEDRQDCLAYNF
jgi:hypothetical protein